MNSLCRPDNTDLTQSIDFIGNDAFVTGTDDDFLFMTGGSIYADHDTATMLDLDACGDFDLLTDLPLLSQAGEVFMFSKFNYLKFCAEQARQKGTDDDLQRCLQLLEDADSVRNHIAECNLRLVISIARRFSNSNCDFDELMSEGNEILLKAISRFDVARGFRFSTYATHSVQRHFFRYLQRQKKRHVVEFAAADELLTKVPDEEMDPLIADWIREEHRVGELVARMAERLDERERVVIAGRYGLAKDGVVKTLRELAGDLGLSKERVRQLQLAAIEKLRDFFDDLEPEPREFVTQGC